MVPKQLERVRPVRRQHPLRRQPVIQAKIVPLIETAPGVIFILKKCIHIDTDLYKISCMHGILSNPEAHVTIFVRSLLFRTFSGSEFSK